jgi:hypothetical protein
MIFNKVDNVFFPADTEVDSVYSVDCFYNEAHINFMRSLIMLLPYYVNTEFPKKVHKSKMSRLLKELNSYDSICIKCISRYILLPSYGGLLCLPCRSCSDICYYCGSNDTCYCSEFNNDDHNDYNDYDDYYHRYDDNNHFDVIDDAYYSDDSCDSYDRRGCYDCDGRFKSNW